MSDTKYELKRHRGKFIVRWYDEAGKRNRRSLGTDDDAIAKKAFADFVALRERPKEITVNYLWQRYVKEKTGRPAVKRMNSEFKHIGPHFGHLHPDHITVELCREYVEKSRKSGRKDGTIWTEMVDLGTVMSWSQKRHLIDRKPFIEKPQKPKPKDRFLTRAEVQKLLAATTFPHVRLAIILMVTTAARIEAVLQLTWDRVDFDRGIIHYPIDDGKRRKGRATPPMNRTARAALTEAHQGALSDYVIEWAGDRVKSIKRAFNATVARAGLEDVTAHTLRHTAAVHMAEAGVSMPEIAQYLGHEDSRITERVYARFSPEHLRKAASALEFFGPEEITERSATAEGV